MFVHAHLGQSGAEIVEPAGGGQYKLTKNAAKLIHNLLSNSLATLVGHASIATGGQVDAGYGDGSADYWVSKYYVASPPPADAAKPDLALAPCSTCVLVDAAAAQANITGTPTDIMVIVAKNAAVAKQLAQSSNAVILPSVSEVLAPEATKKKEGIATPLIGGLIVGAVATAVAGPVAGAAAGLGTAALIHYAA